jgi:hypothetical protein
VFFDTATLTWTQSGLLGAARWMHTATLLGNGKVLAVGGKGNGGVFLASTEIYTP